MKTNNEKKYLSGKLGIQGVEIIKGNDVLTNDKMSEILGGRRMSKESCI